MKRMPRGRSQMPYYGQCPDNEMPHMQRGPCFPDGYSKLNGPCGMGVSEFKSPMMANADPPPPPPKKKRRTSNTMAAAAQPPPSPVMQDLLPPPLTGYGDTIVASNPFDDTPPPTPTMSHMNAMNHVNKHMNVGPCMSPATPMMGSMSPCHIVGSPMNCGPPVGSPINCGPPMGNCSPMSGPGNNPNCGPVGSPHCNSRQVSRSPLVCPPISSGSMMNCGPNSSPLNVTSVHPMNRSPSSLGSPLSSVMVSNVRGNSPLDCGLGLNSVGSQKGSPMSVMSSHNMGNLNCGSPMGSPSNVSLSNCNNSNMNMGSPITSPLGSVPCSLNSGPDLGMNINGVMNRSPMNVPPNSVGSPMLCGSSMRGPSPINSGPMGNSPMNMNCNPNPNLMGKSDLNMNDLAMGRDNCGPVHMKPINPNMPPGSCMPMNNPCSRPSEMNMQCGPTMNNCNPMMNNAQCGPMNNLPCIGNNMNRPPCNPMGMGNPYEGMNPQCRPTLNRSQFPRAMNNMHYGGPNSMNNLCGPPPDMNNMACGPNSNMHCNDSSMNHPQCMPNNMNQCSGGNMFNSPFSPFDSRCSPNMHFNPNEMGMNNSFYRNMNSNNAPCIPSMRNPCNLSSANDSGGNISAIKTESRDHIDLNSDIASCGIPSVNNDHTDDLSLITCNDNFLRDKLDDRKPKDCNGGLLDDDEKLDDIKSKMDDKKDCIKIKDEKIDSKSDDDDSKSNILSTTSNVTGTITTVTTSATFSASAGTTTTTTATVTKSENDASDNLNCSNSNENSNNDNEDDLFKSNTDLVNSSHNSNSNSNDHEETAPSTDATDKDNSEEKRPENDISFSDENDEKNREDKNTGESTDSGNTGEMDSGDADRSKANGNSTPIKIENDEFFDGKNKNDCLANNRPGRNNFSNGNIIPTNNFANSEVSNVLNSNSSSCISDSLCTASVLPTMNRTTMSNAMNHSVNYPNPNSRPMSMFPGKVFPVNKSNLFKSQNPNAPPIYSCGHCHKEVNDNDQAVLCESGCHFWYHRTCSGLTEPAFELLTKEVYAEWVCDKCLTTKSIPLVKFKP